MDGREALQGTQMGAAAATGGFRTPMQRGGSLSVRWPRHSRNVVLGGSGHNHRNRILVPRRGFRSNTGVRGLRPCPPGRSGSGFRVAAA